MISVVKSEVCNWKLLNLNLTNTIIRGEIDMAICYSKEDLLDYESSLENIKRSIKKYGSSFYCIKDCILIKADEIIPLS